MKKALLLLVIVTGFLYSSCKKTDDGLGEIYGKWKLTETLNDPGDGSGKYMRVKGDSKNLTLLNTGQITGDAMPDLMTFRILDSTRLEISTRNYSMPLTYYYKVTAKTLTLNPPCIEGCGLKFIRQ
ncbi:hypothetical protein EZ449_20785 [Pedobacter frigidisoli]|uniref:Lipocalin-like domain-containing protein n=1 Tax=Pedobacter frigidisoli TaxID=2530455 RepID=A0A4R0NJ92_9SPHI|nr:hypothetical protein [Pedobacter frigidisoli]TCD00289.1 hypothetical protein EZ449_20785 [Pedobacter frigidisoli]